MQTNATLGVEGVQMRDRMAAFGSLRALARHRPVSRLRRWFVPAASPASSPQPQEPPVDWIALHDCARCLARMRRALRRAQAADLSDAHACLAAWPLVHALTVTQAELRRALVAAAGSQAAWADSRTMQRLWQTMGGASRRLSTDAVAVVRRVQHGWSLVGAALGQGLGQVHSLLVSRAPAHVRNVSLFAVEDTMQTLTQDVQRHGLRSNVDQRADMGSSLRELCAQLLPPALAVRKPYSKMCARARAVQRVEQLCALASAARRAMPCDQGPFAHTHSALAALVQYLALDCGPQLSAAVSVNGDGGGDVPTVLVPMHA